MKQTIHVICTLSLAIAMNQAGDLTAYADEGGTRRETVLDRKAHIEEGVILDVPQIPPCCDQIPGLTKARIDIGNVKLYCEWEGRGTPLVLLHGGPGATHHYFHPSFSNAKDFARVIHYDQRGTGQSDYDETGETYTVKQAVDDLENLRKALKIDKWVVLGHSYGGLLAQCYALEYPESVLGLVLVTSTPGMPKVKLQRTRQYDFLSKEELTKIAEIWARTDLTPEQFLYNKELNGDWKRQSYYKPSNEEMARRARYEWRPAPGFREAIGPDAHRIDLEGKFRDFEIPTLIVESKWDLTWNTDKPEKLHRNHPKAKMVVLEQSGHSPFADEPEKFFKALRDFVQAAQKQTRPAYWRPASPIVWPSPLLGKIARMPYTNVGQQALDLFGGAKAAQLADGGAWFKLGLALYDGKRYPEALEAFCRAADMEKGGSLFGYASLVWQGHVLDLLNRRDEALKRYRQALERDSGNAMRHDQYGMTINRQWVEERLVKPFQRP